MKTSILTAVLMTIVIGATAQWLPSKGMDGGDVMKFATGDTNIYCFINGDGIYRRNSSGSSDWQKIRTCEGLSSLVAINDKVLYSVYGYGHCWRSDDHGQTWDTVSMTGSYLCASGNSIFTLVGEIVYRSDDYGNTAYPVSDPFVVYDPDQMFVSGNTLFLYSSARQIYISSDLGITWTLIPNTGLPVISQVKDFCVWDNRKWCAASFGIFYYNETAGQWVNTLLEPTNQMMVCNNEFYSCGEFGVRKYDIYLPGWQFYNNGLGVIYLGYPAVNALSSVNTILFAGHAEGVMRTQANPEEWQNFSTGLHGNHVTDISCVGNDVWACTSSGIFKSTDKGINFTEKTYPNLLYLRKIIQTDSVWYAVDDTTFWVSQDHGDSWTEEDQGLPVIQRSGDFPLTFEISSAGIYLVAINNNLSKLFRTGFSDYVWNELSIPEPEVYGIALYGPKIFLLSGSNINVSDDNFSTIDTVIPSYPGFISNDHGTLMFQNYFGLLYSEDGSSYHFGGSFSPFISSGTALDNEFIVCNYDDFFPVIAHSYDKGVNWDNVTWNLIDFSSEDQLKTEINGTMAFILSRHHGLWYNDWLLTGVSSVELNKHEMKISPNPATDFISISIPKQHQDGTLTISDLSGKLIKSVQVSSGSEKVIISVQDLATGLYVVSSNPEGHRITCKLMIK